MAERQLAPRIDAVPNQIRDAFEHEAHRVELRSDDVPGRFDADQIDDIMSGRAVRPPKPTQAEIEAKLGRPIGEAKVEVKTARAVYRADGSHAARVMADIAARKAQRETLTKVAGDD